MIFDEFVEKVGLKLSTLAGTYPGHPQLVGLLEAIFLGCCFFSLLKPEMAASASLSHTFYLYNPPTFSRPSSKPSCHFSIQQFVNTRKPLSKTAAASSFPILNRFGISKVVNDGLRNNRRYSLNPSDSAQLINDDGESGSASAADKNSQPNMKSLMQAYKEAIAYGDARAIYEIENILFKIDKEKNELADKVSALSVEISSGKEKYLRLQADFENYRKRSEKEKLTVRSNAQGEVIESLLPMVDSFEKAKQQLKTETEREKKIDASYQGIYKQFVEIMRSLRVASVPTVGKPFDPLMHEAIAREESHEFKEGIIIQEFRRGFYLGDRLLRAAMVKVSTGPGKQKPPSSQQPAQQQASVAGVEN